MARPKKFTAVKLRKEVCRYFDSISRTVTVTEKKDSGERDSHGHVIWKTVEVYNNLGEPLQKKEFIIPPTVGGLCEFLGIHRSTWNDYCNPELHPEFSDTTTRARGSMRAYLETELLTRKDVKGVIFDLQNNYGYTEKKEIEIGDAAKRMLALQSMTVEEKEDLIMEVIRDLGTDEGTDR